MVAKLIFALFLFFHFGANAALVNSVTVNNPQIPVSQSGIWAIDVTDNFLTDGQLRASPLAVNVQNFPTTQNVNVVGGTVAVSGDITVANNFLTDAQLRASALPVSLSSVPVHGVTQSGAWTVGVNNFPTSFTANIGTTNGLALDTSVNSLLKPASTLNAVTTLGSITNAVTIKADTPANQTNALKVDGSAVTQPISGSVSVSNFPATQAVTGSFLTDTQLRASAVPVSLASVPTHAVTQSGIWNVGLSAGTNAIGSITNTSFGISGTLPAFATTPTFNVGTIGGIATETTLSALNTKTPALGQALMASSVPVVLASNQSSIPVSATISGTPNVNVSNASLAVTGSFLTDAQLRASAVPVSLASTTITNFPATQAISAATLPLPTGAAQDRTTAAAPSSTRLSDGTAFYDARQTRALTSSDVVTIANPQTSVSITGTPNVNITNASIPVTGTFFQATQPISAASLPLPTGATTLTEQQTQTTALQLLDNAIGAVTGTAATASQLIGGIFNTTLPTITSGQQSALQLDNKGRILRGVDNGRISYASATTSAGFTAAATANQDVWRMSGSATKTVYIKKIRVTATATAVQGNRITLIKRSTANTGGTLVANTAVPYDSADVAATASVVHYTAAPTSGTAAGQVRTASYLIPTATSLYNSEMIFEFVENEGNPLVLRGTAEGLGIVFGVAPGAGNLISISVEWDEE